MGNGRDTASEKKGRRYLDENIYEKNGLWCTTYEKLSFKRYCSICSRNVGRGGDYVGSLGGTSSDVSLALQAVIHACRFSVIDGTGQ